MATYSVREVQAKSVINRVKGMPFKWSINPYRGCRHACVYCYARPTHEYLGLNGSNEFEEVILAKTNAADIVRQELSKRGWRGENVVVGTATDPYQQAESRYLLTRGILEAFLDFRNPVSITTKSPMILRDLDILAELGRHAPVTVHFTVTTLDERLWRLLEPTTSKPKKRLEAIKKLRESGVRAGIFLAPVLPGITDSSEQLESIVRAGKECGADFLMASVLRLGPGITEFYLPFIEREFPELASTYRRMYPRNYAPRSYVQAIECRVVALKRKHGFEAGRLEVTPSRPSATKAPTQLKLLAPV